MPSNIPASFQLAAVAPGFNPSNGFVCLRTVGNLLRPSLPGCVSIRRTDLCAFELRRPPRCWRRRPVSIRRTDLCAFEQTAETAQAAEGDPFQSVERICVPSNFASAEPNVLLKTVSIRRTDLCAFERRPSRSGAAVAECFNPSNGFVCLRTWRRSCPCRRWPWQVSIRRTDLCAFELWAVLANAIEKMFQSVERICVPSYAAAAQVLRGQALSFNPSNGFVCLRTAILLVCAAGKLGFNPSNGFVCLRTAAAPLAP